MNAINDADYTTPLREIDSRNNALHVEWTRRKRYGFRYPDLRGDVTGPTIDEDYAMKRMLARAICADIKQRKIWRKAMPMNVSFLVKKKAGGLK